MKALMKKIVATMGPS